MALVRKLNGMPVRFRTRQPDKRCFQPRRFVGLAGAALALSGCATVIRGTHETFRIASTPDGAVAQLSGGESCVTPCAVEIGRADPFQVRISKAGFVTQTVSVRSVTSGAAGVGLLSNALVGGIVGASVDLSSGAMRSLTPNPLKVRLEEILVIAPADFPVLTLILPETRDQAAVGAPANAS
jgi:hypothetical protein